MAEGRAQGRCKGRGGSPQRRTPSISADSGSINPRKASTLISLNSPSISITASAEGCMQWTLRVDLFESASLRQKVQSSPTFFGLFFVQTGAQHFAVLAGPCAPVNLVKDNLPQ